MVTEHSLNAQPPPWQGFAEEVGQFLENEGVSGVSGRVLGWLLVCQPAHQSADELAHGLGISRGSVSMATQLLQRAGAVERYKVAGSRRVYYRMRPGRWINEAAEKARQAARWTELAERGIKLLDEMPDADTERLRETHEMYSFLSEQYARIEELWRERKRDER